MNFMQKRTNITKYVSENGLKSNDNDIGPAGLNKLMFHYSYFYFISSNSQECFKLLKPINCLSADVVHLIFCKK